MRPLPPLDHNTATVHKCFEALLQSPRCSRFQLHGMTLTQTTALMVGFLQTRRVMLSRTLIQLVYARTDGIPLFIQHLCEHMRSRSLLTLEPASGQLCLATSLQHDANGEEKAVWAHLPDSLESLLASVLDKLTPDVQMSLRVASVFGRHFLCSLLHAAHPQTRYSARHCAYDV